MFHLVTGKNWDNDIRDLNPENFELLCEAHVMPLSSWNVEECNLGRIPGNIVSFCTSFSSSSNLNVNKIFAGYL